VTLRILFVLSPALRRGVGVDFEKNLALVFLLKKDDFENTLALVPPLLRGVRGDLDSTKSDIYDGF